MTSDKGQWDQTFSEHSYGFRPGRSAHQAVARAQDLIREGRGFVVDLDLEKFFDRVNHDRLMARVAQRVEDKRVLKLIRAFLNAGVMEGGLVSPTVEGTPQGGPLSPLLSNLVLDELDRELERRGLQFVRYADDCNIYVGSKRAAKRVMAGVTAFITQKLKLKVNESKSAVARPGSRSFLGFRINAGKKPKRHVAPKAQARLKWKVREITGRSRGIGVIRMVDELATYLRGWRGYFGICETPTMLNKLDSWIRRRLRSVVWKLWKTGRRRYAGLVQRGVSEKAAILMARAPHGPWHLSRTQAMNQAFPDAYWAALGLPKLEPK